MTLTRRILRPVLLCLGAGVVGAVAAALGGSQALAARAADLAKTSAAPVETSTPPRLEPTGLIARERATRWDPGLNSVGGIPSGTWPIHATLSPSGGDDTAAINAALAAAGKTASATTPQVVKLAAGSFHVSNTIRIPSSYVVLRGTASTTNAIGGGDGTKIISKPTANGYTVITTTSPGKHTQATDFAENGAKDACTIKLAVWPFTPQLEAGELVLADQLTDPAYNHWHPTRSPGGTNDASRGWFCRFDRPTGQVLEVASFHAASKTVTFTTPLHIDFKTANKAQMARCSVDANAGVRKTLKFVGVEDLYVLGSCLPGTAGAGQGNVWLDHVSHSWIRNVETDYNTGPAIKLDGSFRCVIRDSFVHSTQWPYPGGAGYGIVLGWHAADNLVENNICVAQNKVLVMRATGGGNVIAYNYLDDGYIGNFMDWQEVGANASHMTTPMYELFEGNHAFNFDADNTWGNAIYITVFRNHFPGVRRSGDPATRWSYRYNTYQTNSHRQQGAIPMSNVHCRAAGLMEGHWWYSFVGNVLGGPSVTALTKYENRSPPWSGNAVWKLGYNPEDWNASADPKVLQTLVREGNYDFVTKQTHWTGGAKTLANSLYLTSKPAFFGTNRWPWVDPVGSPQLYTLPAKARFDAIFVPAHGPNPAPAPPATQRITLAQIFVTRDVGKNLERIRAAFAQAEREKAQWVFFPEGALSGYYDGFRQEEVAPAFAAVKELCRKTKLCALLGTCWKEQGKTFNEIRILDGSGELIGRYAKRCLTYSDAKQFAEGTTPLVHPIRGLICGTLICNDLWVTPGYTDGPNPHLTLQMAKQGAQVIFHAVNSGSSQIHPEYHESNLKLRAAEARCPIVVVNAAAKDPLNCASGVVFDYKYPVELPRVGEVIQTVEFTPKAAGAAPK